MKLIHRNTPITLVVVAAIGALVVVPALATPPSGVTNPPWSPVIGRFDGIQPMPRPMSTPGPRRTSGSAEDHCQGRHRRPHPREHHRAGGTFGWHSHPGPSLVIVKSGTLSVYHAPDCERMDYGPGSPNGSTFVDAGHDFHMVRNNGTVTAEVYVVSIVPAGFDRRIEEPNPNPGVCPN